MDNDLIDQSLDKMFEGLAVDEASAHATIRCLVELAYFETRVRHSLKLHATALSRVKRCFALQSAEIPDPFNKLTRDELSRFGQKILKVTETEFKCWQGGITVASLPFSIFCKETKRRIFPFFADPLQIHIRESRGLVDAKRTALYYDVLEALARHCESVDRLTEADEVESLKASIAAIKCRCNEFKEQLEQLAPSDDGSKLERKLKLAQAEGAQLSSRLQKRLQHRML